jgi:hypothetical protein
MQRAQLTATEFCPEKGTLGLAGSDLFDGYGSIPSARSPSLQRGTPVQ